MTSESAKHAVPDCTRNQASTERAAQAQDEIAFWSDAEKARAEVSNWPLWKQTASGGVLDEAPVMEYTP